MAELSAEFQQTLIILNAMGAAHRRAQLANGPDSPNPDPASAAAHGAAADALHDYASTLSTGGGPGQGGDEFCLDYPGEGNKKRYYDFVTGEWGVPC
jgi:hypothetical protein